MPSVVANEAKLAERKRLIEQAGAIVTQAREESREMTAEEAQKFDKLHDEADKVRKDLEAEKKREEIAAERLTKQEQAEASLKESRGRAVPAADPNDGGPGGRSLMFRGRKLKLTPAAARRQSPEYQDAYSKFLSGVPGIEASLQTDIAENGGYLSPPEYVAVVVKTLDNTFWFRKIANVLPPTVAPSVRMPRRSARVQRFSWGQELTTPTPDTALKLGAYTLTPHYMVGEIQVSVDLLMSAVVDADKFVTDEIVYAAGDTEEQAFFQGTGVGQPTGVFVANAQGIDTDRDVTVAIDQAGLMDVKYSLRECYLRDMESLRWTCHRNFVKAVAKLKEHNERTVVGDQPAGQLAGPARRRADRDE
jgi:HK97 family phage major capsid protein